jgi:hypothetical protein
MVTITWATYSLQTGRPVPLWMPLPPAAPSMHVDQLPAAGDQFPEGACVFVRHRPGAGANGFGKKCDDPSVERVGADGVEGIS